MHDFRKLRNIVAGVAATGVSRCGMSGGQADASARAAAGGEIAMPLLIGPEQPVNTYTSGFQGSSEVTALKDGGWVMTWRSEGQDGFAGAIVQQRYTSAGAPVGSQSVVNDVPEGDQYEADVAALDNGGWVVTWVRNVLNNESLRYKIYGSEGTELVVTETGDLGERPQVTGLSGGGWVVTWAAKVPAPAPDGSGYGIYQQRYDAAGKPVPGGPQLVNITTANNQDTPAVARLAGGGWVVTWQSFGQDGDVEGIYQRVFTSTGSEMLGETRVNTTTKDPQYAPSVAGLSYGGWVVTWTSYGQDGDREGVYQQRYAGDGTPIGGETLVNTFNVDEQWYSSVTALADGGWVVTWQSEGQDGDLGGVYQQRFSKAGVRIGGEMQVNAVTADYQGSVATTALPDGGWVVTWSSDGQDGSEDGVYQRRFTPVAPTLSLTGTVAKELAKTNTVVGTLPLAEPGDTYTYALLNDAGDRFTLSGNALVVRKGILLDYEQAKSHTVTLKVTDAAGLSTVKDFTIKVSNVSTEKTAGTSGIDVVVGGGGRDTLGGGGGNDRLTGGGSTDTLRGGSGHDRLDGGLGRDTLYGNSGKDAFLFTTKLGGSNVDTLRDFQPVDDVIRLENAIFKGIGSGSLKNPKKMLADAFQLGAVAQDAEDRILYDQATGSVFYDPDGTGAAAAVRFAVVANKMALTRSDFYVI
jgi:Ca2+-binding RTX toxin-like protein